MLKLLINCHIVKLLNEAKAEAKKGKALDRNILLNCHIATLLKYGQY